jgi:hypothetical protein
MRRFVPPPIQAFDSSPWCEEPDTIGPVRDPVYASGYDAGLRAGRVAGFADGEAQARFAAASEMARLNAILDEQRACDSVAAGLNDLLASRQADRQQMRQEARSAIAAALDILFPTLMAQTVGAEIVALIDQALSARTAEAITIRASAETIAAIRFCGLSEQSSARVTLVPDPDQTFGAADIAWTGGGLTFDHAALLKTVTEAVSPVFMRKDPTECRI